jgi:hypothetical protein
MNIREKILKYISERYIKSKFIKTNNVPSVLKKDLPNVKTWKGIPKDWKKYYYDIIYKVLLLYWVNTMKLLGICLIVLLVNGVSNWKYALFNFATFIFLRFLDKPDLPHFERPIHCTIATIFVLELPLIMAIKNNNLISIIWVYFFIILGTEFYKMVKPNLINKFKGGM